MFFATFVLLATGIHSPTDVQRKYFRNTNAGQHSCNALALQYEGHLVRVLPFGCIIDTKRSDCPKGTFDDPRITTHTRSAPNDPLYPQQWHLRGGTDIHQDAVIFLEEVWERSRGAGSLIAIVDDGFDLLHPDLEARFISSGFDYSDEPNDNDASFFGNESHGTLSAGLAAATANNGIGVSGACPECLILPIRLLGQGGPADLYELDSSAAALAIVKAVDEGADVISNAWGPSDGNPYDTNRTTTLHRIPQALADALDYASRCGRRPFGQSCDESEGLGTVVLWSAGNGGELATYDGFASHPSVVTVGAFSSNATLAFYSDVGPPIDFVAPSGGGLFSPKLSTTDLSGGAGQSDGDYSDQYGGTSAAASLSAGLFGLIFSEYPNITAAQAIDAMQRSAFAIDSSWGQYKNNGHSDFYGYGRPAVLEALAFLDAQSADFVPEREHCGNGIDDNQNGISDADECKPCVPDAPFEICDGQDNDCDQKIDEDFVCQNVDRPICAPCTSSEECRPQHLCRPSTPRDGLRCLLSCLEGGACPLGYTCDGEVCQLNINQERRGCDDTFRCEGPEICDGLDNDCNGEIDDLPKQGAEFDLAKTQCGRYGVCFNQTPECVSGSWDCRHPQDFETQETRCDGLDNDCDGFTDEGCGDTVEESPSCYNSPTSSLLLVLLLFRKRTANRSLK